MRPALAAAVPVLAGMAGPAAAAPLDFRATAWAAAARPLGIDPALLYALALTESRRTLGPERYAPGPG